MSSLSIPNNIANGTDADGSKVDQNFDDIASYVNTNAIVKDATVGFTQPIAGVTPTADSHLATKGYVDGLTDRVGGSWSRVATQSIANSTLTTISFDTEVADTGMTVTVPETAFALPSAGVWSVTAQVQVGATGVLRVTDGTRSWDSPANAFSGIATVTVTRAFAAAAEISIGVWHNEGGAEDVTAFVDIYKVSE